MSEVVDKKKDQNKDVLQHNKIRMKQTYRVPFEPHEDMYVDDAGINLAKWRRRAGQRGGNVTICAAMGLSTTMLLLGHTTLNSY